MPAQPPRSERSRDLERLLTFVDAIAAVAITLLILPLVDLAGDIHSEDDSVTELIRSHSGQFWSVALSFAVIARLWVAQHRVMRPVLATNRVVLAALLLWTLAIVFLPFPTALLSHGGEQRITKALYVGCLAVSSLCLVAVAVAVRRDPTVRDPDELPEVRPAMVTAVLLLLAFLIVITIPAASYYPLFLLLAGDAINTLWRRLSDRRDPARRARPRSGSRSA